MRWWPRSIRWQMLAGLVAARNPVDWSVCRNPYPAANAPCASCARNRSCPTVGIAGIQVGEALEQQRPGWISSSVKTVGEAPNVALAKVTDPAGNVLFVSKGDADQAVLDPVERAQIPLITRDTPSVFTLPGNRWEAVAANLHETTNCAALHGSSSTRVRRAGSSSPSSATRSVFGVIWMIASAHPGVAHGPFHRAAAGRAASRRRAH